MNTDLWRLVAWNVFKAMNVFGRQAALADPEP